MRYVFLTLIALVTLLAACDKADDDNTPFYSDADRARCAHIDREAELGEHLYSLCLCCPYPTSVTPGPPTQDGGLPVEGLPNGRQGVFTGWINDTIAFQSWGPRSLPTDWAIAKLTYSSDGTAAPYRILTGGWGTWNEIDSIGAIIALRIMADGSLRSYAVSRSYLRLTDFGDLTGTYALDSTNHDIAITRWDDRVVSGTIDAWFYDPDDPARRIHFSEGWFDVTVKP